VGTADLVQVRCTASWGISPQRGKGTGNGVSDADPRIAAQLAPVADAWPTAAVIDTEDAGALARPYMLPG
jgi:hypothetical protein